MKNIPFAKSMPEKSELRQIVTSHPWEYFRIKVIPKQPRTEYAETIDDGTIKIRLKAVPEKGKANEALIDYLAQELAIPKSNISILSGMKDRIKLVKIQANEK